MKHEQETEEKYASPEYKTIARAMIDEEMTFTGADGRKLTDREDEPIDQRDIQILDPFYAMTATSGRLATL